jgi:hypothetical protein
MLELMLALNKISNQALDQAETDLKKAQQILNGIGGN